MDRAVDGVVQQYAVDSVQKAQVFVNRTILRIPNADTVVPVVNTEVVINLDVFASISQSDAMPDCVDGAIVID
jgi:hypothetical protein